MKTILLVDDHKIIRDGINAIIKSDSNFNVVGEAADGKTAVATALSLKPDIVVMDINLPGLDGIEAAKEIRKHDTNVKIVILTMMDNENYILDALSSDINGYILKMTGLDEFLRALKMIAGGENYFDPRITNILLESRKKTAKKEILSPREIEILKLIAAGLTSKEIGEKLFISAHTVQKHRKNIIAKLQMHGTAELVKYAIENNLV